MNEDQLSQIQYVIKVQMYYVEYPGGVPVGLWKDGDGICQDIDEMTFEHLQASIRKIDKDIGHLQRSGRKEKIINALVPLALRKQVELQKALDAKRNER